MKLFQKSMVASQQGNKLTYIMQSIMPPKNSMPSKFTKLRFWSSKTGIDMFRVSLDSGGDTVQVTQEKWSVCGLRKS